MISTVCLRMASVPLSRDSCIGFRSDRFIWHLPRFPDSPHFYCQQVRASFLIEQPAVVPFKGPAYDLEEVSFCHVVFLNGITFPGFFGSGMSHMCFPSARSSPSPHVLVSFDKLPPFPLARPVRLKHLAHKLFV